MRIDASPPANTKDLVALKKACEQFEAVFAKQLLSEMRKGVQETSLGDQAGSDIYKDMMDQAIGDSMAHQGALGIGQMLYKEFAAQVGAKHESATRTSDDRRDLARQVVPLQSADESAHSKP